MYKQYYLGIALLVILGVVLSLTVIPSEKEIALMEMEDRYFDEAYQRYKTLVEKGDLSASVVVPLKRIYLQAGDEQSAILLMERYVEAHPDYMMARKELGKLYLQAQRPDDYLRNLEIIHERAPAAETWYELSRLYAERNDFAKQQKLLEDLFERAPNKARVQDYKDLAYLYASRDQVDSAQQLMERLFLSGRDFGVDSVQVAVSLMLDTGRDEKALDMAKDYIADTNNVADAVALANLLEEKKKPELAYLLLEPMLGQSDKSPDLFVKLLDLQFTLEKLNKAHDFLLARLEKGNVPDEAVPMLFDMALKEKNLDILKRVTNQMKLGAVPEVMLIRFADVALMQKMPGLATEAKQNLGDAYLREKPFIAEILTFVEQGGVHPEKLVAVQQKERFTEDMKMALSGLYHTAGHDDLVRPLLRQVAVEDILEVFDTDEVADLFLKLGEGENALARLEKAWQETRADEHTDIVQAWALIASGLGKKEAVTGWMEKVDVKTPLLSGMYYLADKYGHSDLALNVAHRLYEQDPTPEHDLYYTEALIRQGRYEEGLRRLPELVKSQEDSEYLYFAALSGLAKRDGLAANKPYEEDVEKVLNRIFNRRELTDTEKRDLAYMLLESGFRDKAMPLFFDLARKAEVNSPDVEQVVYLWGTKPSPQDLNWLIRRFETAQTGQERAAWLMHLNTVGQPRQVIELIGKKEKSNEEMDAYLQALALLRDKKTLALILEKEIRKETRSERLIKLAMYAVDEELEDAGTAEQALRTLLKVKPDDPELNRNLGQLLYYQARYDEAKQYLGFYLSKGEGDYISHYYYGEILWRSGARGDATEHFDKALQQIAALPAKDLNVRWTEAYLHFRRGRVQDSLTLFGDLAQRYPDNKHLRADYAEVLIEAGQYDRAEEVLLGQ